MVPAAKAANCASPAPPVEDTLLIEYVVALVVFTVSCPMDPSESKNGRTLMMKLLVLASALTSGPRTRICLVVSGARLAVKTGLTVTVVGAVFDGVMVFDDAKLKSS